MNLSSRVRIEPQPNADAPPGTSAGRRMGARGPVRPQLLDELLDEDPPAEHGENLQGRGRQAPSGVAIVSSPRWDREGAEQSDLPARSGINSRQVPAGGGEPATDGVAPAGGSSREWCTSAQQDEVRPRLVGRVRSSRAISNVAAHCSAADFHHGGDGGSADGWPPGPAAPARLQARAVEELDAGAEGLVAPGEPRARR